MTYTHTIVAHFPTHEEAERMVISLESEGFDMGKLSIIGKDYRTTEHVRGFLSWKDTAKSEQSVADTGGALLEGYLVFLQALGCSLFLAWLRS